MVSYQSCLKLLQDRSSLEGLRDGLVGVQTLILRDSATLKAVDIRDTVTNALCRLAQDELGPPLRRLLACCMRDLVDAETRALIPLVDNLMTYLNPKASDVKVLPGGRINIWHCLECVWGRHGRLCASRLVDVVAAARHGSRTGEAAAVRIAAIQACAAAVRAAADSGRSAHEDVLKLCKTLLADKLPNLRNPAAQLALAAIARPALPPPPSALAPSSRPRPRGARGRAQQPQPACAGGDGRGAAEPRQVRRGPRR
jgi:hypothetical protein